MSTSSAPESRTSNGRFWLTIAAVVVVAVLLIGGSGSDGPPFDPRSVNPDGAKGVVETLERLGARVDLDDAVPDPQASTALLLRDRLTDSDAESLEEWVRDGGVLVVADLSNDLAAGVSGIGRPNLNRGQCSIEALADVSEIEIRGSSLDTFGRESCFGDGSRAFIVAEQLGQGTVVTVGSPDIFTNENLDDGDAAVLAAALLAPSGQGAHVSFLGPSVVEFGEETLTDLVPNRVWNALWQLMAAFLIYALYRARRLGGVVAEPVPVTIEGSELVLQAGVLSERAKDPASAAAIVRADVVRRARSALSVAPTTTDEVVAERIASRTGLTPEAVAAALSSPITSEDDLVQVTADLASIDSRLFDPQPVRTAPDRSATQ